MEIEAIQEYRRAKFKALIDSPEFAGNLSAVGRALGYQDGVYVRQMRDGMRAISEKTVLKIEALKGRSGWFADAPQEAIEASASGFAMLAVFEEMSEDDKRELLKDAQERAQKFRRLSQEVISRYTPKETAGPLDFKPDLKYDKKNKTPATRRVVMKKKVA